MKKALPRKIAHDTGPDSEIKSTFQFNFLSLI